jgi:hypothetical protein
MRTLALLVIAGLAQAGSGIELFELDKPLWPDGVEYSFEKPAAEVRLLLAFKSGLGAMGEKGTAALAYASFVVEYNDADRQTCYWNQYRPVPFEAEVNAEWTGDDEAPGLYVAEGATASLTERTLVIRLPRVNRWRVRVTPLEGSAGAVVRDAHIIQVAEMRDAQPRPFEEPDPLLPWEEVEVRAEAEEAEPLPEEELVEEEYYEEEEVAVAYTSVVSVGRRSVRAIGAGAVPRGYGYPQAVRAARSRGAPNGARGSGGNDARAAARGNARPWWQPPVALQPASQPVQHRKQPLQPASAPLQPTSVTPYPRPVWGAPVHGKAPPWGFGALPQSGGKK